MMQFSVPVLSLLVAFFAIFSQLIADLVEDYVFNGINVNPVTASIHPDTHQLQLQVANRGRGQAAVARSMSCAVSSDGLPRGQVTFQATDDHTIPGRETIRMVFDRQPRFSRDIDPEAGEGDKGEPMENTQAIWDELAAAADELPKSDDDGTAFVAVATMVSSSVGVGMAVEFGGWTNPDGDAAAAGPAPSEEPEAAVPTTYHLSCMIDHWNTGSDDGRNSSIQVLLQFTGARDIALVSAEPGA